MLNIYYVDVFTKYAWVKTLKDKKGKTVPNGSIKIVNESNQKTMGKLWLDQGKEFYNSVMQKWLDDTLMIITF